MQILQEHKTARHFTRLRRALPGERSMCGHFLNTLSV
jgi:hypothetical protein